MELIIAMALSFILGAYIRAPFKLWREKTGVRADAEQNPVCAESGEDGQKLERQLNDLLNYGKDSGQE